MTANFIDCLATGESFSISHEEITAALDEYEATYGPLSDEPDEEGE